jgi:hypothetical protein
MTTNRVAAPEISNSAANTQNDSGIHRRLGGGLSVA